MLRRAPAEDGKNFRHRADRDLGRRIRADIQTERRVNLREFFCGYAAFLELIEDARDFSPAANHADVACARLRDRGGQRFEIDFVIPAHHDQGFVILPLV